MTTYHYNDITLSRIRKVAEHILDGKVSVLAGSRKIVWLTGSLEKTLSRDDVFTMFIVIESDTDHLPLSGEERALWAPQALADKDQEIQECENLYRPKALEAAREAIEYIEKRGISSSTDPEETWGKRRPRKAWGPFGSQQD